MRHSFDVDVAKEYGVNSAIVFDAINSKTLQGVGNERLCINGHWWTRVSVTTLMELLPYMTRDKIKNALKCLADAGLLYAEYHSADSRDRTKWYALTQKGFDTIKKSQTEDGT